MDANIGRQETAPIAVHWRKSVAKRVSTSNINVHSPSLGCLPEDLPDKMVKQPRSRSEGTGPRRAKRRYRKPLCICQHSDGSSEGETVCGTSMLDEKPGKTSIASAFLDFWGFSQKLGASEQWVRRNVRSTYTR